MEKMDRRVRKTRALLLQGLVKMLESKRQILRLG